MAKLYLATTRTVPGRSGRIRFINANDDRMAVEVSDVLADFQRVVNYWDGVAVVAHHHRLAAAWIFIAIHDLTLGPAAGGTRIKRYASAIDGLCDAFHLAQAMTSKWAIINSQWGGGKAVLALTRELNPGERQKLLGVYGDILNALNGAFSTAGDLGTTAEDLGYLASLSPYVTGDDQSHGKSVGSGTYTALGLRAAIRACLAHEFGDAKIREHSILVQGLGQVGGMLARLLVRDGARVFMNDLDAERTSQFQKELDCPVIEADSIYETVCDVYAPCGVGGVLNNATIRRLSCRIVCGGANNQLASPEMADELRNRRILYAPDYVVNSGGAIGLTMFGHGAPDNEIYSRIEAIETTLAQILKRASDQDISPLRAADQLVNTILAEARVHQRPYQLNFPTAALARSH